MSLQDKYQPVLNLAQELGFPTSVDDDGTKLNIRGTAKTQYQKNLFWDKLKEIGGDPPADVMADIKVENTDVFHLYTVQSGDSLSKIAKEILGDAGKYNAIFEANRDQLSNPDNIQVGQELKIPFAD